MKKIFLVLILFIIGVSGCETIKSTKKIMPIKDYEQLLLGRIDADYIGTKNCLSACNYQNFIDLKNLPAQAQSLMCLKCHSENAAFNLHNWNAGAHAENDVSCF